ncbi:SRPBCC family protein [Sphingomonas immobilis]|uniref:SRPBCC family protein n=1 Tax=Sphingomonas immobilis TaxID=3063997 RepID=A0ABT9A2D3_9SPHN|nr:SRPBCC family protein [Sphingomonas sp. CA1-15]MDO7844002.1 SRPBCC family protein [Sphingomonas sp. CA1-15]
MVRILHTTIAVPYAAAYAFAHRPENFTQWAAGMSKTLHHGDEGWVADTPEGEAIVTFTPENAYGVLDHRVKIAGKPEIYIPLRMIAVGDATEVELVLIRQPDMDDAAFERDAAQIEKDLATLKTVLETA